MILLFCLYIYPVDLCFLEDVFTMFSVKLQAFLRQGATTANKEDDYDISFLLEMVVANYDALCYPCSIDVSRRNAFFP